MNDERGDGRPYNFWRAAGPVPQSGQGGDEVAAATSSPPCPDWGTGPAARQKL